MSGGTQGDGSGRSAGLETAIGLILRTGVWLSVALVLAGVILMLARHPEFRAPGGGVDAVAALGADFSPVPAAITRDLAAMRGRAFVAAGLLVLIATPVMRVAASLLVFAWRRDRAFVAITALVLAVLVASFLVGTATS